ncbi:phosphatase PAP2 family protein [Parahaliea aestuarii]|uniref:undecaprenyl-diphosphate phosphatase n=1 Tax=Parahaliea aestuarii TaxID=1852021 RepID=A0A5C8ZXG8_9GAMM|nr:phosphatase PAP2 family protein [Parahaliea aestuarii]TXS92454.1 phosphatase PAP2 family protein [Parahaliea aestuarii]
MVRPLARALSRSGDGYLHLLIPLLLGLLGARNLDQFCTLLALSLATERTLYWSLKNTLKRRRPQEAVPGFRSLITASDQFSFPSGHSSAAFLLATVLVLVYGGPVIAMYLWASCVALSRIVLGVHFPGDTLAGAFMGTSCVLLTATLLGLPW